MLTLEKLKGMWNGLPTPWNKKGGFDSDAFIENVTRCVKAGSPGIYIGGSTNEFYAQDFSLFKELTNALLETLKGTSVPNQIGINSLTTDEVIKRGHYAVEGAKRQGLMRSFCDGPLIKSQKRPPGPLGSFLTGFEGVLGG